MKGCALIIQACLSTGRRANTITKVNRYRLSGTTHSSGTDARSVVM